MTSPMRDAGVILAFLWTFLTILAVAVLVQNAKARGVLSMVGVALLAGTALWILLAMR